MPAKGNPRELTGEYIAGLVQADGSFSAVLSRKTRKDKEYFNLSLVFTLVQSQKYKEVILDIQKEWGNIGHWYITKKDNSIRYQVTKQSDLLNVVIPFFMKYQLRSGKLLSFLHFKYIVETMATKAHVEDKQIFLSLVVIASNMNPLGKLGNKIRYLKPEQQHYVINNIQPEGVNISKLTESIANFKSNPLTLDFLHGLFDSNTDNFWKLSIEDQNYIRDNYLPKGVEHWRFKEYCSGLTPKSACEVRAGVRRFSSYVKLRTKADDKVVKNFAEGTVNAIKLYPNVDLDKLQIISENKGKCGIYRWTNLINGKSYIGSSVDLYKRFSSYFNYSTLSRTNMAIYKALLKYGYSNFTLEILEYCDPSEVVSREQHYFDLLKPDYNMLKIAGSSLGYKHTDETIVKLKAWKQTPEHQAKLWTSEHRANNLEQLKILNSSEEQKERAREWMKTLNSSKEHRDKNIARLLELNKLKGHKVEVLDTLNNDTSVYHSIREAGQAIGCSHTAIRNALKYFKETGVSKLVKKRYELKYLND